VNTTSNEVIAKNCPRALSAAPGKKKTERSQIISVDAQVSKMERLYRAMRGVPAPAARRRQPSPSCHDLRRENERKSRRDILSRNRQRERGRTGISPQEKPNEAK
jgi:hypothetical protein